MIEMKDMKMENYKPLMKEITDDTENRKVSYVYGLESKAHLPHTESNPQLQCNPYQNSNAILHGKRKKRKSLNIHIEP